MRKSMPKRGVGCPACVMGDASRKADERKGLLAQPFSNAIANALHDRSEIGSDGVGPHDFVVLVLDDMTVPDEAAWQVELRLDARNLAGNAVTVSLKPVSHGLGGIFAPRVVRNCCRSTTWN